jgi:general transcription factor 3C polypeptide 3 (transcription factor C subunit 4)
MELGDDSESSWAPSGSSFSSEVSSSDLDEFIMSTSQSGALSRHRKKAKGPKDGLAPILKRKKKKNLSIGRVSQEVRDLLGQGHNAFLKRDYDTAVSLLEEAIRLAPGLADPFVTLGAIYEELNDAKRSLEALLVAVHLTPGDTELWKRVAIISESEGNFEQAIYCLKRCVKASEEPFLGDLGNLLVRAGKFQDAVLILRKLFSLESPEEAVETGSLLAKSLYNINEKTEAMSVLESLVNAPGIEIDANIINMLAEVYLDVREWGRCFTLLTSLLDMDNLSDPEKCPVDLVAKLALAAAPNFNRHERICTQAAACVVATPVESHLDLYLLVADGLLSNNIPELAWTLIEPALPINDITIKGKAGRCCYMLSRFDQAAMYLSDLIESERMLGKKPEPDTLVMLADALRKTGREAEAGDLLLHSLNYEDLLACRTLPPALSTTQRRRMVETLNHLIASISDLGSERRPVEEKFASTFLHLLNDCELDSQRIARHRAQGDGETPAWRVRKELDLEGVEETLGAKTFVELILVGADVCAVAGRAKEAVELIEAVLYNKRKKWSQRSEDGGESSGELIEVLEKVSFKLAVSVGINKVSTKYLRQSVVEMLEKGEDPIVPIARMTQLMFQPASGCQYTQREVLDQRSWLVRLACKNPTVFSLVMMCGHMCVYSSNNRFACDEFLKASRLKPDDPWPLLCLGANLIGLAMSRTTKDRQLTVLKAFAIFGLYKKRRTNRDGEIEYNFGRAFHQLSLWSMADRHYQKALECGHDNIRRLAGYNLSLIRNRLMGKPQLFLTAL